MSTKHLPHKESSITMATLHLQQSKDYQEAITSNQPFRNQAENILSGYLRNEWKNVGFVFTLGPSDIVVRKLLPSPLPLSDMLSQ